MIKKNKLKLILASLIILFPILIGVVFWDSLPDSIATHWGIDGEADGFSSKAVSVFALPLILLLVFWLCILGTAMDKKQKEQSPKALNIIFFIIPALSVIINAMMYAFSLGVDFSILSYALMIIGVLFVVIGNLLPKCRQNLTLGIKIKWTLLNEENWNATHRFSGRVWVVGGVLFFLSAFLPEKVGYFAMLPLIFILVIASVIYSYLYYKKQVKEGRWDENGSFRDDAFYKKGVKYSFIFVPIIIALCLLLCFTGKIEALVGEDFIEVKASYMKDIKVAFDKIDSVELRDDVDFGFRQMGFGTPVLSMGSFRNKEFGSYTLYAYTNAKESIVIRSGERVLVLGVKNASEIYEEIKERVS